MTDDELNAIEARANAATAGPWEVRESDGIKAPDEIVPVVGKHEPIAPEPVAECHDGRGNATFIAHARTDVPALVAEVRRLQAALERIKADEMGGDEWYVDIARKALEGGG